jgi:hypothetical protein
MRSEKNSTIFGVSPKVYRAASSPPGRVQTASGIEAGPTFASASGTRAKRPTSTVMR